jgi:DNA-binding XRE family transcriptional regulator
MTAHKQKAAQLVAAGKLTQEQIAAEVGVCRRTVCDWKQDPEFLAAVKVARNAWRGKAQTQGLADRDFRLRSRNDRHRRLRALIEQRAKDPQFEGVAGGNTGLLTVTYKMQSQGEGLGSAKVPEYAVDTGLLAEMLELEEHSAIDSGQWKEKDQTTAAAHVAINTAITVTFVHAEIKVETPEV